MANRKAIRRQLREMGIEGIAPGPNTSTCRLEHRRYPYWLRRLPIARPDHVWGVGITDIRLRAGWMHLVAVLDWYSRYVVAWALDQTLELGFVLEAMAGALARATPEIRNSDQGSHFTSPQHIGLRTGADVRISMGGRGRALDNVFTERLWRSAKYEAVYIKDYASPKEARRGPEGYFAYYNHERPHQALGYQTPAEVCGDKRQELVAAGDNDPS